MVIKKHVPANVAIKKEIKKYNIWDFREFGQRIRGGKNSLKVSNLGYKELWTLVEDGLRDHSLLKPHKNRKEAMEKNREKDFEEYKNKMIEWAKWKLEQHYRYRILWH